MLGDFEVDNQPGAVNQRRDKRRGDHRRVNADAFDDQRDHRGNHGAPEGDAHQRQADNKGDFRANAHYPRPQAACRAEGDGDQHRRRHLFTQDPPQIPKPHFAKRHRAHQSGRYLRAAVASGANQQWDKERQRDGGFQRLFEVLDHGAGVSLGDKQQQQPDGAFFPQRNRAYLQIGFFQRQRRPLKLRVFGDFIR